MFSFKTYEWKFKTLTLILIISTLMNSGISYIRPPARKMIYTLEPTDLHPSSAQQVHISLAGKKKMRISWVTQITAPSVVYYGLSKENYPYHASGTSATYKYLKYKSGINHHVVIGPLKPSTTYFYKCSHKTDKEYSFRTPPATFPLKFVVSGDLGQTEWTRSTLEHISKSGYDVMLLPGDLSYADHRPKLWDTFGRLVEPMASRRPWMTAVGNHEPEKIPLLHSERFTAYNARWRMPSKESNSASNLYYSFDVAGVHVIVLASYTHFKNGSPQYIWLKKDLKSVDRSKTPWLIVMLHAPWYNSNKAHQGEKESVEMKASMEPLFKNAQVDIVFTGHVHAYERFGRVFNGRADKCGQMHITIGDGGNYEGLALKYLKPTPTISSFREASFGHGELLVHNNTHAKWTWHRNDDAQNKIADSIWLTSLSSKKDCKVVQSKWGLLTQLIS